jgi:glycosyltransferase involved in cell wall biosynthesis
MIHYEISVWGKGIYKMAMRLLVIIPAYNEAENIKRVVGNLVDNYPQYDYVVINDGSHDSTEAICKSNGFNYVNQIQNLGLAGTFQTGMKYAKEQNYDAAVQYDGDGQHRAEFIQSMLDVIGTGSDIVIGSRFLTDKKPKTMRMLGSFLIEKSIKLITGQTIHDPTSGMRMYSKRMIEVVANNENMGPEPDSVAYLIRCGAKVSEIQVKMDERIAGESYLNISTSIKYMFTMFISILLICFFRKKIEL